MQGNTIKMLSAAAVLSLGAIGATMLPASAEQASEDGAEVQQFNSVAQSLTDAVGAAEGQSGATAMSAEFELEGQKPVYEVELVKADGTISTAVVDASTGEVKLTATSDDDDREDEEEDDNR